MSFQHAPVTKGLMITCGLTTLMVAIFDVKHYFHIQLVPHLSRDHQYWRLFTQPFVFGSLSELFIWEILMFNAAIPVERSYGSVKFASYLVITSLVATIAKFLTLPLLYKQGLNRFPPGPTSLAFNILYQYSRLVPPVYRFSIFNVVVSNKVFGYILALQAGLFHLAISQSWASTVLALIGFLTGAIYRAEIVNLKSFRLPNWLVRVSSKFLLPLIGDLRPPRRSPRALPDDSQTTPEPEPEPITTARQQPGRFSTNVNGTTRDAGASVMREWVNELTGRAERASTGIRRVPPEAEIAQVMAMFPDLQRDVVVAALQRR
ncbi:hypothetical protein K488DRAFT_8710, partial [Vararia minispora EC-137]